MIHEEFEKSKTTEPDFVRQFWQETQMAEAEFEAVDDLSDAGEILNVVQHFIAECDLSDVLKGVCQRFLLHFGQTAELRDYIERLAVGGVTSDSEKRRQLATLFSRVLRGEVVLEHALPSESFESIGNNQWHAALSRLERAEIACR